MSDDTITRSYMASLNVTLGGISGSLQGIHAALLRIATAVEHIAADADSADDAIAMLDRIEEAVL
jgi:hypothetical protein